MNTKETLIEKLKKGNWYIDLYRSGDSFIELLYLLEDINDFTWSNGNHLCELSSFSVPRIVYGNKYIELYKLYEIHLSDKEGKTDLTQLFNEYLEKYEPKIWMHSVLAALQLGLKVEHQERISEYSTSGQWWETNTLLGIGARLDIKYRIDYKEPIKEKLVPDEVWELFGDEFKYIARDKDGVVCIYTIEPEIRHKCFNYWSSGSIHSEITYLKIMKNAKIHDVDWKDSLCVRPTK